MSQNIPVNQQNAIPIWTLGGGLANIVGGTVTRSWDSDMLGIKGALVTTLATGETLIASNWLDVSGCSQFALAVRRTATNNSGGQGVVGGLQNMNVWIQYRMGPNDSPPLSYNNGVTLYQPFTGRIPVLNQGVGFPNTNSLPNLGHEQQTAALGFNVSDNSTGPFTSWNAMIGSDVRLILSWGTLSPPTTDNTFSAYLWGMT